MASTEYAVHSDLQIRDTAAGLLVLVVVSVAMRMYTRLYIIKKTGPEDWVMVVTLILAVTSIACLIMEAKLGIKSMQGPYDIDTYNRTFFVSYSTYIGTLIALKISISYFFLRIFTYQRVLRIFIYSTMVSTAVLGIINVPFIIWTCGSMKTYRDFKYTCPAVIRNTTTGTWVAFSTVNIASDIVLAVMASVTLWRQQQMPILTKLSAATLLCMGSLGCVASIVRLAILLTPADVSQWFRVEVVLYRWMLVELCSGIVAANIALTRPLFRAGLLRLGLVQATAIEQPSDRFVMQGANSGRKQRRPDSFDRHSSSSLVLGHVQNVAGRA